MDKKSGFTDSVWSKIAILIAIVTGAIICSLPRSGRSLPNGAPSKAMASASSVATVASTDAKTGVLRPLSWVGLSVPDKPTPQDVQAIESLLMGVQPGNLRFDWEESKEHELLAKIEEAKRLVAQSDMVPDMWMRERVMQEVASVGKRKAINSFRSGVHEGFAGGYILILDAYVFNIKVTVERNVNLVASTLVHEATHQVFISDFLHASGMTSEQLFKMMNVCGDFGLMFNFTTESASYGNQAAWCMASESCKRAASNDPLRTVEDELIVRANRGEADATRVFARFLRDYAHSVQRSTAICGPSIILSGPKKGEYLFPSDIYQPAVRLLDVLP